MRSFVLILAALCYIAFVAAWPWPPSLLNFNNVIGARQAPHDLAPRAALPAAATTKSAAKSTEAPKTSKDSAAKTTSTKAKSSGSAAATTAAKSTGKTTDKPVASKSVAQDAPAGGFSMLTPAQTTQTYAKIGAPVTFVWNYTSLLVPPSAVDVVASNTEGAWTIASNMSVKETGSVVWNTSHLSTPLPMESYTLYIFDSQAGATAVPKPGHLNPFIGYGFAMYSPQPYVPSNEYYCVTCSGAVSAMERQSLAVILGTCLLTILSFTYFSCGFFGAL